MPLPPIHHHAKSALSPSGALLALVCFFLPWGRFSCMGMRRRMSGAQLGGAYWIIATACVAILVAILYFASRRQLHRARPIVFLSSLAAIVFFVIRSIGIAKGQETGYGRVTGDDIGVRTLPAVFGTVVGLVAALVGSFSLGSRSRSSRKDHSC